MKRKSSKSEIQLSYKSKVKASMRPKITGSKHAHNALRQYWTLISFVEQFKVMLLNTANEEFDLLDLSTGSTIGTIADSRLIFCTALKGNACGIIVSHNHPSGNLTARQADIALTNNLKEAGKFLEIQLLDHIITADSYASIADEGSCSSLFLVERF